MCSLSARFDYAVAAIEEGKDNCSSPWSPPQLV